MIGPRDDLTELAGYHSAQVEVDVRLNTNEAPEAPPQGFSDALARELAADRLAPLSRPRLHGAARGDRSPPRGRPGPGVRGQRVERGAPDALPRLRRSRPIGRGVRAHLRAAQPHRHDHRHGCRHRRARRGVRARPRRGAARRGSRAAGHHVPLLAQQPHRHGGGRGDHPRGARPGTRPARGRRGLRAVLALVGARAGRPTTCRSSSHAPTRRPGRWRPPGSGT